VIQGEMSRIRFAHEVWRVMPESFYASLAEAIFPSLIQQ
jgi:hypothetical protein